MKLLFYAVITAAISCGLLFPKLETFASYIPLMIGCMLFFNFLDVKIDIRRILRKELLVTFFLSFVLMPFIAYHVLSTGFEDAYRIGLLLVACAPAGIMGMIMIRYIRDKDYSLAFSNFLFSTFSSIFFIPLVLKFFLGQSVAVGIRPILIQTALLVIIPYTATRLVNRLFQDTLLHLTKKISGILIPVFVFLIVSISIGSASADIRWNATLLSLSCVVFAIYLFQGGLGFLAGYLFDGSQIRNTLALIASSRNTQLVLAVAILNFSPLAIVPIIIATFFHHLMNAFWLWVLQRK